tara:strand:- start:936 stop:1409 length:474 start_codon:yes stop_codon:yes gene_type:complete
MIEFYVSNTLVLGTFAKGEKGMPLFDWSNRFSVGIKEMDEQHKKLIGLLNDFHNAKLTGKEEEVMAKLLNGLLGYTKTHFKKEEELMSKYEFPEYDAHILLHLDLDEKVKTLQEKFLTGDKVSIYPEMAILLNDWLAEHIMVYDKDYGKYLNSKGVT